jgi:hypothetical protein
MKKSLMEEKICPQDKITKNGEKFAMQEKLPNTKELLQEENSPNNGEICPQIKIAQKQGGEDEKRGQKRKEFPLIANSTNFP